MAGRILLIDDEPDFTEIIQTMLSFQDFEVDAFNDSREIMQAIETNTYALIISDLMMPNIDGFELMRSIREKAGYEQTPIIVLSAKTLTDSERKTIMQHQAHFLTKPFEPQGLVEKVEELLA